MENAPTYGLTKLPKPPLWQFWQPLPGDISYYLGSPGARRDRARRAG
jgi:hypothetical protein